MEIAKLWYGRIFVAVTGLLMLAALTGRQLNPTTALVVLVAGVVLLGLPHGALDPMVARKAFGRHVYTTAAFYAAYLALVLGYWLLWKRYPTLGSRRKSLPSTRCWGPVMKQSWSHYPG